MKKEKSPRGDAVGIYKFKKVYDRLKNCVPIQFTGESFRKDIGNQKKEEFRQMLLNAQESF